MWAEDYYDSILFLYSIGARPSSTGLAVISEAARKVDACCTKPQSKRNMLCRFYDKIKKKGGIYDDACD